MSTVEEIKTRLTQIVAEVNGRNVHQYYEPIESLVREWRDSGGRGGPVHVHMMSLSSMHEGDWHKQDVLELTMERMTGWCAPPVAILFPDWDEESRTWKDESGPEQGQS
jgi:hypothetical protein